MLSATSSSELTRFGLLAVTDDIPFEIILAKPAVRAIQATLPEAVAAAVIEFVAGPLLENPHRVGEPLRGELDGIRSARRGTFRILYRIDEARRTVTVLGIGHRGSIYR